jgi:hypothetical protein
MHIDTYYAQNLRGVRNHSGILSDWLDIGTIELHSGRISVGDAVFFPGDQIELDSLPGVYQVQARVIDYGIDRRIGLLRARIPGMTTTPIHVGAISVDFAVVGVCDHPGFLAALEPFGTDLDQYNAVYGHKLDAPEGYGRIVLQETPLLAMIFVQSGWGDGQYDVYQLMHNGSIVGLEVIFIDEQQPYLFEGAEAYNRI